MKARTCLVIIFAFMLVAGGSAPATSADGGKGGLKFTKSGTNKRNTRIRMEGDASRVTVMGYIDSISRNSIVLDGERFYLSRAEITDEKKRAIKFEELYPGLKVSVVLKNGGVERVVVHNMLRPRAVKFKDKEELERFRSATSQRQRR